MFNIAGAWRLYQAYTSRGWFSLTKKLCSLLLVLFLLVLPAGTCSAMYQISEQELTQLENNLAQLAMLNSQLLTDLESSKTDLQTAKSRLNESQEQLIKLQEQLTQLRVESNKAKIELEQAQKSLRIANESLQKYEQEVKSEKTRLTWQRNLFAVAALYFAFK